MTKHRYITCAIDYVNAIPHLGTAYEKIGADILSRFYRMQGDSVLLQMGNDEHSVNVYKTAKEQGLEPKAYCDGMRPKFESAWSRLHIAYDQFIQTSELKHHESVTQLFEKIFAKGDIYKKNYEGWYCESCEAFYTEKDLVDGLCANHKKPAQWISEENYFFKLSAYSDFLLDYIESHPHFILPLKRRNEIVSFIKQGLQDISVSRSSFDWGIPLPIQKNHVVYVWFDALINYITGAGFAHDDEKFKTWWPNTQHIIGKDITRFHCIIWPAMLQSAGLPLPQSIFAHGFVYLKGEKMSKSLGNVVTPLDVLKEYPEFGADALRYCLMRTASFGDDSNFTWEDFTLRYNADLANGVGNLVSRTLGMIWRYQKGVVEPVSLGDEENRVLSLAEAVFKGVQVDLDPLQGGDIDTHLALEKMTSFITAVDQYIDQKQPWTLAKNKNSAELSVVLTTLVEAIRLLSILFKPFIPNACDKIWQAFGFSEIQDLSAVRFDQLKSFPFIKNKHSVAVEQLHLFPRIEVKMEAPAPTPTQPAKVNTDSKVESVGLIDIADFGKVQLKVAKILKAEKHPSADRLLVLSVELGTEVRQVVSGIAEFYSPEQLVGKSVALVTNLKPVELRGVKSEGMILAAKKGKTLVLMTPDGDIPSGTTIA